MFRKIQNIHFVGIGGIGMSGIAQLLYNLGYKISGSDLVKSDRTKFLDDMGIQVMYGHDEKNIDRAQVVVFSSAVKFDNPEIIAANSNNIPVIRRAEMLGELLKLKPLSIAVSGTHGKTSTSSMLGSILNNANESPTLVIGGIVKELDTNFASGEGNIILVEADEFDKTFLSLNPTMSIITNIDLEHLDCYKNLDELMESFSQFANSVPFYGKVIISRDDVERRFFKMLNRPFITYGVESEDSDFSARNIIFDEYETTYELYNSNHYLEKIYLNVPGIHNVKNSLAAISCAIELEIDIKHVIEGLRNYSGVSRRFERVYNSSDRNISIIDDYAHHPTEIVATINAAKNLSHNRIIVIFQPHLFSRTKDFCDDFADSLFLADKIILTQIFGAREKPIPGVTSEIIIHKLEELGHKNSIIIDNKNDVPDYIKTIVANDDLIITMGAGSIYSINKQIKNIISSDG